MVRKAAFLSGSALPWRLEPVGSARQRRREHRPLLAPQPDTDTTTRPRLGTNSTAARSIPSWSTLVVAPGCALPGQVPAPTPDTSLGEHSFLFILFRPTPPSYIPLVYSYRLVPRSPYPPSFDCCLYTLSPTDRLVSLFPLVWLFIYRFLLRVSVVPRARFHFLLPLSVALASRRLLLLNLALFVCHIKLSGGAPSVRRGSEEERRLSHGKAAFPNTRDGGLPEDRLQVRVLPCRFFYLHVFEFPPKHTRHRAAVGPGVVSILDVELRAALVQVGDRVFALVLLVVVGEEAVPVWECKRQRCAALAHPRRQHALDLAGFGLQGAEACRSLQRRSPSSRRRRRPCQLLSRWLG